MTTPTDPEQHDSGSDSSIAGALSRRRFLRGAGEAAASGLIAQGVLACAGTAGGRAATVESPGKSPSESAHPSDSQRKSTGNGDVEMLEGDVEIELTVNGAKQKVGIEPRTTLLNALRNRCEPPLTGTKLVCDRGNCGACTVLVDGKPAYACLLLAADMRGKQIRTVEGLAKGSELSALQSAFCEHDALMCGFCTPGFLMAITACLEKNPRASLDAIKESCAGNVCRCGTYPHIFDAALAAGKSLSKG
jgi:xanthine dehydrogenase YagT iron-sulfur-binding subunit